MAGRFFKWQSQTGSHNIQVLLPVDFGAVISGDELWFLLKPFLGCSFYYVVNTQKTLGFIQCAAPILLCLIWRYLICEYGTYFSGACKGKYHCNYSTYLWLKIKKNNITTKKPTRNLQENHSNHTEMPYKLPRKKHSKALQTTQKTPATT